MTRITNVDHLVLLLRQRLNERAQRTSAQKSAAPGRVDQRTGVQALSSIEEVDDRTLRRALIQDVLAEHFGRALLNEAEFQQIVDRVTSALEEDRDASKLFGTVTAEVRRAARQG